MANNKFLIQDLPSISSELSTLNNEVDNAIIEHNFTTYKIGIDDLTQYRFRNITNDIAVMKYENNQLKILSNAIIDHTITYVKTNQAISAVSIALNNYILNSLSGVHSMDYILIIDRLNELNNNNMNQTFNIGFGAGFIYPTSRNAGIRPKTSINADYRCIYKMINVYHCQELYPRQYVVEGYSYDNVYEIPYHLEPM